MDLFPINCPSCRARLKVCELSAIGQIVNCPKCGSMLQVTPPQGWQPTMPGSAPVGSAPVDTSLAAMAPTIAIVAPSQPAAAAEPAAPAQPTMTEPAAAMEPPSGAGYVDPQTVQLQLTKAASASAAFVVPRASTWLPLLKGSLAAWLPWAGVPVSGILSAWLVGYYLHADKPMPRTALANKARVSETTRPAAVPATKSQPQAAPKPQIASAPPAAVPSDVSQPQTAPVAPTSSIAASDSPSQPPESRVAMRPIAGSPELEAAARNQEQSGSSLSLLPAPAAAQPPAPVAPAAPRRIERPRPPVASSPPVAPVDVNQALDAHIKQLDLPSMPLVDFVQLAGGMVGTPLTLDCDACRELGLRLDTPLVVHEHDVSLADLLRHVLARHGLVAEAWQGQLVITSTPGHRHQLQQVRYPVSDLGDTPAALASMIERLVEPTRWVDHGGAGRIDLDGPQMLITQTPRVQHQVAVLLDKLRLARGKPAVGDLDPLEASLRSSDEQLADRLATLVSMNFRQPTELRSVIDELARLANVRVLVDWQSLAAARCWPQSLVSLVIDKQPLAAALEALLGPLDLSYRVVAPRTIEVSSIDALEARPELDVYPVGQVLDMAPPGESPAEAIAGWFRSRLPEVAWGVGTGWRYDRESACLLVRQDVTNQRRIRAAMQLPASGSADDAHKPDASMGAGSQP